MQPAAHADTSYTARCARYCAASSALAMLSTRQLKERIGAAPHIGSGIGGTAALLQIAGQTVFVKRVPLTALEQYPDNFMSTKNLFALPTYYQYGVGSAGFGVWRELAAHVLTTNWVLGQSCESFPLLYHWRVLEETPAHGAETVQRGDLEHAVAFWHGSTAVRERFAAVAGSTASVALFLEYLPYTLHDWLTAQRASSEAAFAAACAMVERSLNSTMPFMASNGFFHFDAHFRNILTDGRRLYLADLGLATSMHFTLAEEEEAFLRMQLSHDHCYALTQLVNWLVTALSGAADRNSYIRACAASADLPQVQTAAATLIKRYAPVAAVMNEFYRTLHSVSRMATYPLQELQQACRASGIDSGATPAPSV